MDSPAASAFLRKQEPRVTKDSARNPGLLPAQEYGDARRAAVTSPLRPVSHPRHRREKTRDRLNIHNIRGDAQRPMPNPPPPGGGVAEGDGGGGHRTDVVIAAPSVRLRLPPPPSGGGLWTRPPSPCPHPPFRLYLFRPASLARGGRRGGFVLTRPFRITAIPSAPIATPGCRVDIRSPRPRRPRPAEPTAWPETD